MLEQLREDGSADDPQTRQELARLVALLRSLPELESPPDLAARVLAYVAQQESRPRVLRRLPWRPAATFLIAASIAALFAVTFSPETIPSVLRPSGNDRGNSVIREASTGSVTIRRRPRVVVHPQWVHTAVQTPAAMQFPAAGPRLMGVYSPAEEAFAMRLDHQLNQLMINPTAFAQRLELVAQRDQFIARLAERAAERGDAPEIALRVRESAHPIAGVLVERLLRATLVADFRPR
jgi:hypothetical protein